LPQLALREIEKIEFVAERLQGIGGGGKLGDTSWEPETGRAIVRTYLHISELNEKEHETIVHEVGHEIFLKLLTSEEKSAWGELYKESGDWFVSGRAIRSSEEDFCECFRIFFTSRVRIFAKRGSQKYNFMKNVVKRLEKMS